MARKIFLFLLPAYLLCAACTGSLSDIEKTSSGPAGSSSLVDESDGADDDFDKASFDRTVKISWTSSAATVSGDANSVVSVSGTGVTVKNTADNAERIIYELSGNCADGFFKVYSSKRQAFVLNGLSLTNKKGAAINNQGKKRCYIVVKGTNTLADGASYSQTPSGEQEKAALFSEGQLIFSGDGTLTVNAVGNAGITSDDYVRFMASPTVKVSSSAGNAVRGKDYILVSDGTIEATATADMKKGFSSDSLVRFEGGTTTIKVSGSAAYDSAEKDYSGTVGIKADKLFEMTGGDVTITNTGRGGKGIKVGSSSDKITLGTSYISGGNLNISVSGANYTTGDISSKGIKVGWAVKSGHTYSSFSGDFEIRGGKVYVTSSSAEAIEIKRQLTISGGEVYAYSTADDAINCCSTFTISGGKVFGGSTSNDGLDSNGNFYIKGGLVYAYGKSSPELAIDANTEGGFKLYVSGGTVFVIGGIESGASLTQSCYSSNSWTKNVWYSMTVGSETYAFKTPSSAGSSLIVSAASQPSVKSNVTVSGGTSLFNALACESCSASGGSTVSLSNYTSSGGGGGGRW